MSMNLIPGIESTGSALSAEKIRLEIIAQNIANSNTTQDASGKIKVNKEVKDSIDVSYWSYSTNKAIQDYFVELKVGIDEYVEKSRIPSNLKNGVESLNYINPIQGQFQYKWTLYSAGHAELDINKDAPKEDMVRNRDRNNSWILGDSGGFQIGKGVWEGDWKDPNCPKAQKKRDGVLKWMDAYMDYGMILDIPA